MNNANALPEFRCHGFDRKFIPLTLDDLRTIASSTERIRALVLQLCPNGLEGVKVLDLGCGRGELVAALRNSGARAFGVEIDDRFVQSGKLLNSAFKDEFPVLSLVSPDGCSCFPDDYFDIVVSDQVLEHVRDLDNVAMEISRVLRSGGISINQFPARFRIKEPHYGLPFVHWLPKGWIRYVSIRALLTIGLSGKYFPQFSLPERALIISRYADAETFYRSVGEISQVFRRANIERADTLGSQIYAGQRFGRIGRYPVVSGLLCAVGMATYAGVKFK